MACGWQATRIVKDWHGHDRVLVAEAP